MCNWDSDHLGDVFQYIKDPTPQGDSDAHFAWRNRWVEAYKEAQWWIKIGGRYYREVVRLRNGNKRALLRIADMQHELSKYGGMCAKCKRGQIEAEKAKEIIRELINLTEPTSTEEVQHWNKTFERAEAFIKEAGQSDKQ